MLYVAHQKFASQHQLTSEYPSVPSSIQCRAVRTSLESLQSRNSDLRVKMKTSDWQLSAVARQVDSVCDACSHQIYGSC